MAGFRNGRAISKILAEVADEGVKMREEELPSRCTRAIPVVRHVGVLYRVFVTNMSAPVDALVGFYGQRAVNLTKEPNNDAGLAAHP